MKPDYMKLFCEIFLLFLLIGTVSAISLDDLEVNSFKNLNYFSNDTNVTVGNHNFTIPEGFALVGSDEDDSLQEKAFANRENETILISFLPSQKVDYSLTDYPPEDVKIKDKVINNNTGLGWKMDGIYSFTYLKNGDLIIIQSTNESYISKVC